MKQQEKDLSRDRSNLKEPIAECTGFLFLQGRDLSVGCRIYRPQNTLLGNSIPDRLKFTLEESERLFTNLYNTVKYKFTAGNEQL